MNSLRTTLIELDEADMRQSMERILSHRLGRRVSIVRLDREPSSYATLFPVEIVSVLTDAGDAARVFVKHFGDEESDHPDKQCREREVRVYEQLLQQDERLPVVRYYGSRANSATGRREMYLEYVDDWKLKYHELRHWFTAARALAQLHAHFARRREELLACDFLMRFDERYLDGWVRRAAPVVSARYDGLGQQLGDLLRDSQGIIELIARQPVTLVHNDLSAKNVIAAAATDPARICIVDWEMAGIGCALLDLVHLKYNRLDPENDRRFCEAYFDELGGDSELAPRDEGERSRLLAACEWFTTAYRLAHCVAWNESAAHVAQRLDHLRDCAKRLE